MHFLVTLNNVDRVIPSRDPASIFDSSGIKHKEKLLEEAFEHYLIIFSRFNLQVQK